LLYRRDCQGGGVRRFLDEIDREPVEPSCAFHCSDVTDFEYGHQGGIRIHRNLRSVARSLRDTAERVAFNIDSELANNQIALAFKIWMKLQLERLTRIKQALYDNGAAPDIFTDAFACYTEDPGQR